MNDFRHQSHEQVESPPPPLSQEILLNGTAICEPGTVSRDGETGRSVSFRILGELGHGGMGLVYRAEQLFPRRIVALKVLKRSISDAHARKRFVREIEITGRLAHRGIAQLFFAGVLEDGLPFMAMEFVSGVPLTTYAQARKLSTEASLQLFMKICDIIAYAHRQGVIHRDLKPSNILVDQEGEPKVLDFGLATAPIDAQATQLTVQGQLVGTLDYMSPEQADGSTEDVDQQSDVYSLGIVLYELLAAHRPFDLSSISLFDAVQVIRDSLPPRLSGVNRSYRGDLDTIVHKALSKEKSARYATVDAFSGDIRRWLAHEPIHARSPSFAYRTSRFVRRHRGFVGSALLIILSLAVGLVFAAREAVRANAEARRAEEMAISASKEKTQAEISQANSELLLGDALAAKGNGNDARTHYELAWTLLEKNSRPTTEASLRVWQLDQKFARMIGTLETKAETVQHLALSNNQQHLAIGYADGKVEIRNPLRNHREWSFQLQPGAQMAFSPNGEFLLTYAGGALEVRSLSKHERIFQAQIANLSSSRWAIDDEKIVYLIADQTLHVQYLANQGSGSDIAVEHLVPRILNLKGSTLVLVDNNWNVRKLAMDSGQMTQIGVLPGTFTSVVCISPDGVHAALTTGTEVSIFDLETSKETGRIAGCNNRGPLGFGDDQTVFASSADGSSLLVADITGHPLNQIATQTAGPLVLSHQVAVVKNRSELNLWSVAPLPELRLLTDGSARPVPGTLSTDGYIAALAQSDGRVMLIDTIGGHPLGSLQVNGIARTLAFDRFTQKLAVLTEDNHVQVWDLIHPAIPFEILKDPISRFGFSPNGDLLVLGLRTSHELEITRLTRGTWVSEKVLVDGNIAGIGISSDSSQAALMFLDGHFELWNAVSPIQCVPGASAARWDTRFLTSLDAKSHAVVLRDPRVSKSSQVLPMPSLPVDATACASSILAAMDGSDLFIFDMDSETTTGKFSLPLDAAREIHLSADGSKMLLTSRKGAAFIDFSVPGALRSLEITRSEPGKWWDQNIRRWLIDGGLAPQAFASFPGPQPNENAHLSEGYALWAAGRTGEAVQVFQRAAGFSDGTRRLLLAQLEIEMNSRH